MSDFFEEFFKLLDDLFEFLISGKVDYEWLGKLLYFIEDSLKELCFDYLLNDIIDIIMNIVEELVIEVVCFLEDIWWNLFKCKFRICNKISVIIDYNYVKLLDVVVEVNSEFGDDDKIIVFEDIEVEEEEDDDDEDF